MVLLRNSAVPSSPALDTGNPRIYLRTKGIRGKLQGASCRTWRTGDGSVFIDTPPGRASAGMKVERSAARLWVAGGFDGHAYVYSTRDGSTLANLTLATGAGTLINDVMVTNDAAYFTDPDQPSG